jgi:hypothetical protein
MRARRFLAVLALVAGPALAAENTLDIGLNADAVRGVYSHTFDQPGLRLDGGWLHHQDNGDVLHAGLLVVGDAGGGGRAGKITAGLGARLAFFDGDGSDREGFALAPGARVTWTLPRWDRVSITGEGYFAPDILAGGDAEEFIDLAVRGAYAVTRQARIYVGARYVRGDFDGAGDVRFDTGLHAGLDVSF